MAGPPSALRLLAIVAALAGVAACAGTPESKPAERERSQTPKQRERSKKPGSEFPSPERLQDLSRAALPPDVFERDVAHVESWKLLGPFPERIEVAPYADEEPAGELLDQALRRRSGILVGTEAMHCAAREFGRFLLEKRAHPSSSLEAHLAGRCHAASGVPAFHYLRGEVPVDASNVEVRERWRDQIVDLLDRHLAGGPRTAGIWFGRRGDDAIVVLASERRRLHLDPIDPVSAPDGVFVISGETLERVRGVSASVTVGRYGYSECGADPMVRLPRFRFECRTEPSDPFAWIHLSLSEPGRLISRTGAQLLVWPAGAPGDVYRQPSYAPPRPIGPDTDVIASITELVNEIRESAGLAPMELSPEQSEIADGLAPHFFSALFGRSPEEVLDLVILGMMAGWSIEGIVQSGEFTASWVAQSEDLAQLLSHALEYPSGREALLNPDTKRLAVGGVVRESEGKRFMAAVYGSYTLFSEEDHDAAARRVYQRIRTERERIGLAKPGHLVDVAELGVWGASRVQSGDDPNAVLQDILDESAQRLGRSMMGWVVETTDLDSFQIPDALLERARIRLAIGVAHRKPRDQPWGRYVILLVAAGEEQRGA